MMWHLGVAYVCALLHILLCSGCMCKILLIWMQLYSSYVKRMTSCQEPSHLFFSSAARFFLVIDGLAAVVKPASFAVAFDTLMKPFLSSTSNVQNGTSGCLNQLHTAHVVGCAG